MVEMKKSNLTAWRTRISTNFPCDPWGYPMCLILYKWLW